jgi:hypothetical protein
VTPLQNGVVDDSLVAVSAPAASNGSGAPDLAFGHGGVIITTFPHAADGAAER